MLGVLFVFLGCYSRVGSLLEVSLCIFGVASLGLVPCWGFFFFFFDK
jgi:hypothetical protein